MSLRLLLPPLCAALLFACAGARPAPEAPLDAAPDAGVDEQAQADRPLAKDQPVPFRPLLQPAPMTEVVLDDAKDPILTFRLVFRAGSVDDPKGKEGLTALTAKVLTEGGTKTLTAAQLLEALYPIAGQLFVQTDKELTAIVGRVHEYNADRFVDLLADTVLKPRLEPREFERLRTDAINAIKNQLRGQDDEALGKVALDALLYEGHPYAHFTGGTVEGLSKITLEDVRAHWQKVFTQDRLVIGLAGNVTPRLKLMIRDRLTGLPATGAPLVKLPPAPGFANRTWLLQKPTLSTAISMGYSWPVRRGDPDFFPLAVALSYLGEHRQFHGVLFNELREKRGLNYGDYAYPEHFVQEGWSTYALTNIARAEQDVSIWIRPVEPAKAIFAARAAVHYLRELVEKGIPPERFEIVRGFLQGYTRLWEQTASRRLGYATDALFYGTPKYLDSFRAALETMTPEQVDAAVRRHLDPARLNAAFVAPDAKELREAITSLGPTPIEYASPRPPEILEKDRALIVEPLPLAPSEIERREVGEFMAR